MFVDVVLPSRRNRIFTYRVPVGLQTRVHVGSTVVVPLGTSVLSGAVVSLDSPFSRGKSADRHSRTFRDVISVKDDDDNPPLNSVLFNLVKRVSRYYVAPVSSCLHLILPPAEVKVTKRVFLTDEGRKILEEGSTGPDDLYLLRRLENRPTGLLLSTFRRATRIKPATLVRLKKNRWIEERPSIRQSSGKPVVRQDARDGPEGFSAPSTDSWDTRKDEAVELPPGMDLIVQALEKDVAREAVCVASRSSRWKGMLHAATRTLKRNRRVLLLVPEVQLVEALASRCRVIWGQRVGIFHGELPPSIRGDQWRRIQNGELDVVVGTRSAVFLPLPHVGLIWLDREEDASYMEEHFPYYHAREVARMRADLEHGVLVYGSSMPSLELYDRFRGGVTFSTPSHPLHIPLIETVTMQDFPHGTVLSPQMIARISQAVDLKRSVILFQNRKGFSHGLVCKDCGHVPVCPDCQVSLKLYRRPSRLLCSYCGYTHVLPEVCASCQGRVFRFTGVGTQRLEEEVAVQFPSTTVARFDRENLKTNREAETVLEAFRRGDIRILIGTEWLFHRPNPPRAFLVGFPQADSGMHLPDFRSAERTYRTLCQAVKMAGQGSDPGTVVLQTRMPGHHVFQSIASHDPGIFYHQEMALRKLLGYPPFSHLLLVVVAGSQPAKVNLVVEFFRQQFEEFLPSGDSSGTVFPGSDPHSILGPIPSRDPRGAQKTRTIFLVKTVDLPAAREGIETSLEIFHRRFPSPTVVVEIHVDPLDIH